jgi:hypothetical protein
MLYTVEVLEKKLQELELLLSNITQNTNKDPYTLSNDIGELTNLHSSSVNLMTASEYHYHLNIKDKGERGAKCRALKMMSERLNNSIGKAIESYRSMLSFEKLDYEKQTRNG